MCYLFCLTFCVRGVHLYIFFLWRTTNIWNVRFLLIAINQLVIFVQAFTVYVYISSFSDLHFHYIFLLASQIWPTVAVDIIHCTQIWCKLDLLEISVLQSFSATLLSHVLCTRILILLCKVTARPEIRTLSSNLFPKTIRRNTMFIDHIREYILYL